ncbi:MAG TPA: thioredoxin-like domain-containing protein [Flavitalea sp.]|nr:thioredoxin-like domain-containing protein [Flavitalea sp.]
MKQVLLFITAVTAFSCLYSQTGYKIDLELKPFRNTQVYLGYYYGEIRALADSTIIDGKSMGIFKGTEPLPGGIYFVVSPTKQILFELLIDKDQYFSVKADTSKLPASVKFSGSDENNQFQEYSFFTGTMGQKINELNRRLAAVKTQKDSAALSTQIKSYTGNLQKFRDSILKKYPESFLSALFKAMQDPKIPPASQQPGGKYDSNFVYHYYKDHYWDDMSYTDDRMVRTPFFESKLVKYYQDLVSPHPDSLIREIDHMLLYSRASKEMYKFLMVHFVQKYINPQFMGQDAVFVHLFEKYINTNKAEFFTPQYKDFATKRAYSLMANLIGRQAPQLDMVDTLNKPLPLYNVKSAFTVIVFWDPTCSHCKEIVPKVDSMYEAKWKNEDVQVYAVKTDGTRREWLKFIADNHLNGWKHVYPTPGKDEAEIAAGRPGYKQLYDVYQTPLLYLLDKDKRIIAKKLTYLQINEVINSKLLAKGTK